MTQRSSITAHKIPSRNLSSSSNKKNRRKLLSSSKKRTSKPHQKKHVSYFLRIFVSGMMIVGLIAVVLFLKKNLSNTIDLNDSFTMLIQEQGSDENQKVILSLRGTDKSVNYSVIREGQDSLVRYFPIDAKVQLNQQPIPKDKSSFTALFAPWSRGMNSELSLVSRFKIWQYLLTIDSAHFQEQEVSNDSDKLLLTVQKYFADTELRQLAPTIAVVNTTQQNGLAKRQADILNAWGFTVIQVDSKSQQTYERTQLISDSELVHTRSAKRLQLAFPDLDMNQDEQQLRFYRTQFVLFIGNDYK